VHFALLVDDRPAAQAYIKNIMIRTNRSYTHERTMKNIPEPINLFGQIKELLTDEQVQNQQTEGMKQGVNGKNTTTPPKGRILLINDNPRFGRQLVNWCTEKDYVVTVARNDNEARSLSKLVVFDVIIKSSEIISAKKLVR